MLRPSARNTYRIARLVMRTHAVPTLASTNGTAISATAIMTIPTRAAAGWRRSARMASIRLARSCSIRHPLAEEAGRPEDQHGDQHEEREHVLVVAAEERQVGIAHAALG